MSASSERVLILTARKQVMSPQTPGNGNHGPLTTLSGNAPPPDGGKLIVLTAPLTETIDHAGYFIQMAMASLPIWMEGVLNRKYPKWREVERAPDGSARYMPAGGRLVEASRLRAYKPEDIVACLPDDLDKIIGTRPREVEGSK